MLVSAQRRTKTGVLAAAFLISACGAPADAELCNRGQTPEQVAAEYRNRPDERIEGLHAQAEACVVRTAYDLAPSPDPVDDVAAAVLISCRPFLTAYDAAARLPGDVMDSNASVMRQSMHSKAFETVVRARAGHCG